MKLLKRIISIFLILLLILAAIFALGRYGWKLLGFQVCEEAGIESVEVGSSTVKIKGFSPRFLPGGLLRILRRRTGRETLCGLCLQRGFRFL